MKVRDAIKFIEADGWYLVTQKGTPAIQASIQSRQGYHRRAAESRSSVGHTKQHSKAGAAQGEVTVHRFLIVIEKANGNYSAYAPDLPGCVATGETREEVEQNMYEAIQMHVQGLLDDNMPVPESQAVAEYVAIP